LAKTNNFVLYTFAMEDNKILAEHVKALLEKSTGAKATVVVDASGLTFTLDPTRKEKCLGGWSGVLTKGTIARRKVFPKMVAGIDPLRSNWIDILEPKGWFE
jgi:hypothetical protein